MTLAPPIPDPEETTKVGELMVFGPVSVDDLRHIAKQIEEGFYNSPKDGMYLGQPAWAITKT